MDTLKDKVVIVTGSSAGIGRGTAVAFAKQQSRVVFTGRNEMALEAAVQECRDSGAKPDQVIYVTADVTKDEDLQNIINTTITKFGKIDVLVNNAGMAVISTIEETKMEDYDRVFNTNLKATFRLTQLAIPHLKKSKGCIVNVSSVNSYRASPMIPVYCMTKAALDMFTNSLVLEMAPHQVRVNAVNPGEIKTTIQGRIGVNEDQMDEYFKTASAAHPLQRCGDVKEVADVILFLASDGASFVTGAKVPVDGGMGVTTAWFGLPY